MSLAKAVGGSIAGIVWATIVAMHSSWDIGMFVMTFGIIFNVWICRE